MTQLYKTNKKTNAIKIFLSKRNYSKLVFLTNYTDSNLAVMVAQNPVRECEEKRFFFYKTNQI